jgi:hypothetical protein
MPAWGLGIGAAAGLLKTELIDQPAADARRKVEAVKERWSPWTGQHGDFVANPNPISGALGFGAAGAQVGASIDQTAQNKKLDQSKIDLNKNMGNFYANQGNWGSNESPAGPTKMQTASPDIAAAAPVDPIEQTKMAAMTPAPIKGFGMDPNDPNNTNYGKGANYSAFSAPGGGPWWAQG